MKTTSLALFACLLAAALPTANGSPAATPAPVTLRNFNLVGDLAGDRAAFVLTGTAHVENSRGGSLDLLSGPVALTAWQARQGQLRVESGHFILTFERAGDFPIEVRFGAAVRQADGWNGVDFHVASSVLEPVRLRGLAADTQFQFAGAARPERTGADFFSYLPPDGSVKFSWKEVRRETEDKLFFSAGMLSQISVSPGLMRQVALAEFKVMQGEISRVAMRLHGAGEVTRVQGDQVLAWNVEPAPDSTDRRLVIQFNQPQKDQFLVLVQVQTPLGAFPLTVDVPQLRPENATQFAGYFRIVNEGAVRLEVAQASGASQISPDQFPETDATRAAFRVEGNQRFAYRFAGAPAALRIQADQILPELAVSEVLAYHDGENELDIDGELELDIREAPLRELALAIPKGYAVARINAPALNDYSLREPPDAPQAELRLIFGQPISGRQVVQLRLEHNQGLGESLWTLPRVDVPKAKSMRGFVGVSSDAGLRMTVERTQGLTEIAPAFYPAKLPGMQTAFRLTDAAWEATLRVERLPQTVQAEVLHLFSVGEGIAYGSSVINYVVSGAPVAAFKVELSSEYENVEFTGKDVRAWPKVEGGYLVQLHTPAFGACTLLATYERPFKSQGETLAFTGARPLDAQSEQGYTLVTSAYQFQVKPADVSPGLLPLEPGEVPPEYRLFFDAPILAAYRYASRPFHLSLALSPLAQADSLNQIVDRASLRTRVSKEGQTLTEVRYFIKSRGNPHFRLTVPEGAQLWSAAINGAPVVPVSDGKASLIPLPRSADPDAVLELDLKLASQSGDPKHLRVAAPVAGAPVLLAQWKLEPDAGQRLEYINGSVMPAGGVRDVSGFAQLARLSAAGRLGRALALLGGLLAAALAVVAVWRRPARAGAFRYSGVHLVAVALGFIALMMTVYLTVELTVLAGTAAATMPSDITLLVPVQQAGSALEVAVSNVADKISFIDVLRWGWPVPVALALWLAGWFGGGGRRSGGQRSARPAICGLAGWTLLAWAALRLPNGAAVFLWVLMAYLLWHALLPALDQILHLRPRPEAAPIAPAGGAAPAATGLIVAAILWLGCGRAGAGGAPSSATPKVPDSVTQIIRVEDNFARGAAKIHWQAIRGQALPLLAGPAVLTHITYPERALQLLPLPAGSADAQQLVARESGAFDVEVQYEKRVTTDKGESGLALPVPWGLINQLQITVANLDVDVFSAQAVSIQCDHAASNTVATLVLSPANAYVAWRPRSRDVRREKPVFYAEIAQLYVPSAGVIEGVHYVTIRPAQGELDELVLSVPPGATVTDVLDPARQQNSAAPLVSVWRFDPDARKLRVSLTPPQSRPFALAIRSQVAAGPLPFQQSIGLMAAENAAGQQIGLAGIATGSEVQLDTASAEAFSPINLEDFPGAAAALLQSQIPGLTLRRAFSYSDTNASLSLRAVAVEPDVRVESDDTLSLGEDRTVLADNFTANITRAGIFELTFLMPAGFDMESISGAALSQWTESKTRSGRVITLHLAGKTLGQAQFALTLLGPGVKSGSGWKVPQVALREAAKQSGTLLIVPEQGMRLQAVAREGCLQLDPQKSGIRQKGVLAFRVQAPANLALDIEQVEARVQVSSLQQAAVSEAQIKVAANLEYEIENTGLKSLRLLLPESAEGVRFQGEEVADFLQSTNAAPPGWRAWDVKLRRRFIGSCLVQAAYQTPMPRQAAETVLRGVIATNVNLQRGFVTVQSDPRLEIIAEPPSQSLQPTEWQSIPRALQRDLPGTAADFTYRLIEPSFQLPLILKRHPAESLLPARVNNITFDSAIADDGGSLTRARLEIMPGDKRLVSVALPKDARFWFALVNDYGVWPWRDGDNILIPLQRQPEGGRAVTLELFYGGRAGSEHGRALDLNLAAPKFDLPLENITWRISLSGQWRVKHWTGSFQFRDEKAAAGAEAMDPQSYLQNENNRQLERTRVAEQFMAQANSSLENGNPQLARRAFEAAYGLSTHDAAFNEDARVQLHNIKLQQALIGLNVRQSAAGGDTGALGGKLRDLRRRPDLKYTQQDAKDILDINTADDNAAFLRVADKLVRQQDAAVNNPAVLRAGIPEQGRILTFQRSVAVDPRADLGIGLTAKLASAAPPFGRLLEIIVALAIFAIFGPVLRLVVKEA